MQSALPAEKGKKKDVDASVFFHACFIFFFQFPLPLSSY